MSPSHAFISPRRRWPSLLLALCCCLPPALQAADESGTRTQLEQLKSEMGKLQGLLRKFKDEHSQLQGDLRKSEVEIGTTQKKIQQIEEQLREQERQLQQMEQQRQELQQSRQTQQQQVSAQVRAAYQLGRQNKLKALLNQEDPNKLSRALVYYDYFNRARAEQIEAYIDVISELDAMQPQIERTAGDLRAARTELDQKRRELLGARRERERALARLASTIQGKDAELKQMTQDRGALEQVLRRLEQASRAAAAKPPAASGKPGAQLPAVTSTEPVAGNRSFRELRGQLPWPVSGRPSNRFGTQRGNSPLRWQGINITAAEGTTVRAIHHGKVVFADWLRGSGLLIIVDHGNGFLSLYAHNQALLRNVGAQVRAGDPIATVGNSGGQQQAGLYFEIRHRGVPTDPAQWCRRA